MQWCIKDNYGLSTVAFFSSTLKLMTWTAEISIPRDTSHLFPHLPFLGTDFPKLWAPPGTWDKGDSYPGPGDRQGPCSPVVACVPWYKENKRALLITHSICSTYLLSRNETNSTAMERVFPWGMFVHASVHPLIICHRMQLRYNNLLGIWTDTNADWLALWNATPPANHLVGCIYLIFLSLHHGNFTLPWAYLLLQINNINSNILYYNTFNLFMISQRLN